MPVKEKFHLKKNRLWLQHTEAFNGCRIPMIHWGKSHYKTCLIRGPLLPPLKPCPLCELMISRGCCQGNIGSFQTPASIHRPQSLPLISLPPRHESHSNPPSPFQCPAVQLALQLPVETQPTSRPYPPTQKTHSGWRETLADQGALFQGQLLFSYPLWTLCGHREIRASHGAVALERFAVKRRSELK